MRRWTAIVGLLAFAAITCAQDLPSLGAATPIDVRVESVNWHPRLNAFFYTRTESDSTGIGVYSPALDEGKVLLHAGKGDRWEAAWLAGAPSVIINFYHPIADNQVEATVYLLDAKNGTLKKAYSHAFLKDVEINVDTSPLLKHAIFTLATERGRFHMVLPSSGSSLIPAPDLDQAEKEGLSGPTWTIDGTAAYVKGGSATSFTLSDVPLIANGDTGGQTLELRFTEVPDEPSNALKLRANFRLLLMPTPDVGATVLELMPSNAVLRQVRFKGPYADQKKAIKPLAPAGVESKLQFGVSIGSAHSLWLTSGQPKAEEGVLIAAHSDKSWLAPDNRAIAYRTDGALFVRQIESKKS
jgi:hypothetical protein